MTANLTFNQSGIPPGVLNEGREDGKDDGTKVVATISGYSHTFRGELLWVGQHPTPDTASVASFAKVGTTLEWTPSPGVYGTWILMVVTDEGTPEQDAFVQGFAIKQSPTALRIPAPQERGDELASLQNATSLQKRRSWFNKPENTGPFSGAAGTWAPWWRPLADLLFSLSVITPVPSTRTLNATSPIRIDGAGSADLSANRTLSITAATTLAAGSMSASDKSKLDGLPSSSVPTSRNLTATSPLTGGGDLSADRSFGIQAASGAQDGYLASSDYTKIQNAVPNTRAVNATSPLGGGGALSSDLTLTISAATTLAAGSMSASDKSKLDGIAASAAAVTSNAPQTIGTANSVGTGTAAARDDHVHAHGNQTSGTLHAIATGSVAGFMSAADKTKLDSMQNALSYVTVSGTSKTLALSDAYTTQEATNASTTTITVPTNASVAYDIGTVIALSQIGAGQLVVAGAGGVTVQSSGSELKAARQFAVMFLQKRATDTWLLSGEKTA